MVASTGGLRVSDLVRRPPLTIYADEALIDAVDRLVEYNVGILVVIRREDPDNPVAVISERDVIKALGMKMPLSTPVEAFMSTGVVSIEADQPLSRALELMEKHNIRHLVVTMGGKLYGVISIRDLMKLDIVKELCEELK
ncbi:MAG: CBS domain-containing protein [Vulcanisaeta sp.]|jgi:CBS domain-containing protein|nr:CBS domain-containing protein [Vulcanisaeta sp.]MDT7969342.1 CBS domain-containing protein [Vulcanisaeta sp.]